MTKTDLRAVSGRRLRWQYFGPAAWFGLGMAGFIPYMIAVISLMMGRFNWADLLEFLWISAVLCGGMSLFFFGLTALNRACFGRVICVLGEDGLYHSGGMIPWGEIKRIEYIIDRPRRYRGCREKFCRGVVYADGGECGSDPRAPLPAAVCPGICAGAGMRDCPGEQARFGPGDWDCGGVCLAGSAFSVSWLP